MNPLLPAIETPKVYGWCRLHHSFPGDKKWRLVARETGEEISRVEAVMTRLYTAASANPVKGRLDGFSPRECAADMEVPFEAVARILTKLTELEVISQDYVTQWDKWQPSQERKTDNTAAERAARYRARKRAERDGVTVRHGVTGRDVTPQTKTNTKTLSFSADASRELTQQETSALAALAGTPPRQGALPLPPVAVKGRSRR